MNAVVYARESEGIDDSSSVAVQLNKCTAYARRLGCTRIDIYYDRGVGRRSLDRPGLQATLDRIRKGEVDYFIFPALGCLSPKVREQLLLIKTIEELGIRVAAACTPIPRPLSMLCLSAGPQGLYVN